MQMTGDDDVTAEGCHPPPRHPPRPHDTHCPPTHSLATNSAVSMAQSSQLLSQEPHHRPRQHTCVTFAIIPLTHTRAGMTLAPPRQPGRLPAFSRPTPHSRTTPHALSIKNHPAPTVQLLQRRAQLPFVQLLDKRVGVHVVVPHARPRRHTVTAPGRPAHPARRLHHHRLHLRGRRRRRPWRRVS